MTVQATTIMPSDTTTDELGTQSIPAIKAIDLCKIIDDRPILNGLTFQIETGKCTALLGANGAGKTTLMHILATLSSPTAGQLNIFGKPITRSSVATRREIGMIGHQSMLYRDLSALENLIFFGRLYSVDKPAVRAMDLLHRVGLADRAPDAVRTFSRGMTQRLSIARALMHHPKLLLADEPFAGLDVPSVLAVEQLLADLVEEGCTVVLSNHDVGRTLQITDHVLVLHHGQVVLDTPSGSITELQITEQMCRGPEGMGST